MDLSTGNLKRNKQMKDTNKIKVIAGFNGEQQRKMVTRLLSGETQQVVADSLKTSRGTVKRVNSQMRPIILAEQALSEAKADATEDEPILTVTIDIETAPLLGGDVNTVVITTEIPQEDLEAIQQDIAERVSVTFSQMYGHTEGTATVLEEDVNTLSVNIEEEFNVTINTLSAGDDEIQVVDTILSALGLDTLPVEEIQPSSFTLVPNSIINIAHDGGIFTADMTHPCFKDIVNSSVEGDFDTAVDMIDVAKAVTAYSDGAVTIDGEKVLYNGMEVKDGLAMRILELMREGDVGFKKYVAFMGRLRANPSYRAVTELFGFIGHADVEITEDGYLIGWKRVKSNYTDCRTGLVKNYIGNIVQMPRNMVNEDSDQTCSQGLHVAAWSYLSHFRGGVILKVKVDPADVVSIPTDYKDSKMRAARYEPIAVVNWDKKELEAEYTGNQVLTVGEYGKILKIEDRTTGEDLTPIEETE